MESGTCLAWEAVGKARGGEPPKRRSRRRLVVMVGVGEGAGGEEGEGWGAQQVGVAFEDSAPKSSRRVPRR